MKSGSPIILVYVGIQTALFLLIFFFILALINSLYKYYKNKTYFNSDIIISSLNEMVSTAFIILLSQYFFYRIKEYFSDYKFIKYSEDFILIIIIIFSIILLNNISNNMFITLDLSSKLEIRLVSSIYTLIVLLMYNNFFDRSLIVSYISLLLGRFIFFDTSFKNTFYILRTLFKKLPLIIILLLYTHFIVNYFNLTTNNIAPDDFFITLLITYVGIIIGFKVASRFIYDFFSYSIKSVNVNEYLSQVLMNF